ncbi:TonB-dependent receptor [Hymenobacter sp. BT18]|uniref:SusC/RagA family TonB-linked outer membrane protein n=1 Tax=Hymenobacter sp. BT18 TaxID=2835648 RepID=UPI00143E98F4|nr:TonB-dependent receptor [Hymenobacter sp. BT18]QIX62492.1 TonB-dependent receptor [Hymenobacter sp. BT18]
MRKLLLLTFLLVVGLGQIALAQDRTITGRVTDRDTNEGLPGITVLLKGTTIGVSTNTDGTYTLSLPAAGGTLSFSSIGYTSVERSVTNESRLDVIMAADTRQLSEVVVTGFGIAQERKELTGAIATVKARDFENQPIVSVDQALQGRAAGVQVTQNSGTPGSGIAVRVRGSASIGAGNEPLYVIDGLPINTGSYTNVGTGGQLTNALSDLNPNDIESIEVLKDAAAAAIYGSRGSNGVVLISTKRGKAGRTRVGIDYYRGAQTAWKKPEALTGQQQTELFLDQARNRYPLVNGQISAFGVNWRSYADLTGYLFSDANLGVDDQGQYIIIDNGDGIRDLAQFQDPSTAPNTNWANEILRTAPITNHELNISGGTDRNSYRVSGSYFSQDGIIIGSGFNRASGRIVLDNKLSDHIRMGLNLGLNRGVNTRIQNDNNINGVLSTAVLVASDIPVFRPDGTYAKDPASSTENPLAAAREPYLKGISSRVIGTHYTEFEFIKDLKYRATFGLDYLQFKDEAFFPTTTNTGRGTNGSGIAAINTDANFNHISSFLYTKTFGDHTLNGQVVLDYQQSTFNSVIAQGTGFPGNTVRQLAAAAVKTNASSSETQYRLFGTLVRVNYNFRDKYLLGASVRRDGSSRFGVNNRYGIFPAASVGWRISEEAFLKDNSIVSDVKLRASYGETGNQEVGNFASRGLINTGANFQQVGGLAIGQLENRNLQWERTATANVGLDVGLIDNRVYLAVDAYNRDTRDLLLDRLVPGNTGYLSYSENIGNMRNRGLEVSLNTVNVRAEEPGNFSWETNFNIAFNRNEVTKLTEGDQGSARGFASWLAVGQPLGAFRGYRVEGIFQTQEEIDALDAAARAATGSATARYQAALTRPGDIKFRDINGRDANGNLTGRPDGRITGDDQEILGNAQPKFFGGLTNTIRWKGFDLSAFIQYSYGNKIYNNNIAFAQGMNGVFGQDASVLNRWTPSNTNTNVPRAVYGDPNNNRRVSDRFIEDGSYARLKNLTIGYTVPQAVTQRFKLSSLRVYAQAQNLVTLTDYSGLDPEVNTFSGSNTALGTDFLVFPQARTITGGISLGF